jgi:5'-3' exonuclease
MNNIILVDSSYTSFHRFFATLRWFSFSKKEEYKEHKDNPKYDWSKNKIFLEKYEKMYVESIKKLVTPTVFNNSIIIFCLDAPQESLWRNDLMECYKGERVDLSKKHNFKPTFKYTYSKIIPELVKNNSNIFMIKYAKMEADDIIALCTRYIRKKHTNKTIYLVSGDNDFLQLGYENLYFADYKKKELKKLSREEAKEALEQKIINGDCSDNIPNIFPKNEKISNKLRKEIRENKEKREEYFKTNKRAYKQYKKNKQLISFKYIPKEYQTPIYLKIKKILV